MKLSQADLLDVFIKTYLVPLSLNYTVTYELFHRNNKKIHLCPNIMQ